jgi:hypothetical protein
VSIDLKNKQFLRMQRVSSENDSRLVIMTNAGLQVFDTKTTQCVAQTAMKFDIRAPETLLSPCLLDGTFGKYYWFVVYQAFDELSSDKQLIKVAKVTAKLAIPARTMKPSNTMKRPFTPKVTFI